MEETGTGATTTPMARTGATSRTRCTARGRHRPPQQPQGYGTNLLWQGNPGWRGYAGQGDASSPDFFLLLLPASPAASSPLLLLLSITCLSLPPQQHQPAYPPQQHQSAYPSYPPAAPAHGYRVTPSSVDGKMSSMFQPHRMNSSPHRRRAVLDHPLCLEWNKIIAKSLVL